MWLVDWWRRKTRKAKEQAQKISPEALAFQPDAVQIEEKSLPLVVKFLIIGLTAFFVIIVLWLCFSFVDTVVTTDGVVTTSAPTLVVESIVTGEVEQIHVKQGEFVEKDQPLITLEPTLTEAQLNKLQAQVNAKQQALLRLKLEEKFYSGEKPDVTALNHEENLLLHQRVAEYAAQMRRYQHDIEMARQRHLNLQTEISHLQEQVKIFETLVNMHQELEQTGASSKKMLLEAQQSLAEAKRRWQELIREDQDTLSREKSLQAESEHYTAERLAQLLDTRIKEEEEFKGLQEELKVANRLSHSVVLKAPSAATVLSLKNVSQGAVVNAGETLLTLVPRDVPLEVELNIPNKDIAEVKIGNTVKMKVEAYKFQQYGVLTGKLVRLSGGAITEEEATKSQNLFYRGIVWIDNQETTDKGRKLDLLPGMRVQASIVAGKRRLITYIFYPLLQLTDEAMHEI